MEYIPYTYLIGWSTPNIWYYGVQYRETGIIANPKNLWTNYFTSSKQLQQIRKLHGEPDVIQVRKTFKNKISALRWEQRVIRKLRLHKRENWLNNSYMTEEKVFAISMNDKVKKKISEVLKSKNSWVGEKNPGFGKVWINDGEANYRIDPRDLETCLDCGFERGMYKSPETRKNMSIASKNRHRLPDGKFWLQGDFK